MASFEISPSWADELRNRYLRGESSLFVLHGNVHDLVFLDGSLISVSDYLSHSALEKKDVIIRYNVSTGCRFIKKKQDLKELETLLTERSPNRVLPVLEQVLFTQKNIALIIDYADMVAPEVSTAFASEQDRLSVVSLHRWSLAPQLDTADNIVVLLTETAGDLHPKIIANPRVAAVRVHMPSFDDRKRAIELVNPDLSDVWTDRFADTTAGLKLVQIKSILQPSHAAEEDATSRFGFILSLVRNENRARKLASLTSGMSRDDILELVGMEAADTPEQAASDNEFKEVIELIGRRKKELIERECFGLIEFVDSNHDFTMVGGITEIKRELVTIAKNIRDGRKNLVPMGLLFTGPMGTGKTFVAEAFVKESGLTGIKFKNFRSKWVGATESNLERILNVVQAMGNVIVIIDEGDRSFGSGDGEDGGTSSRVIARLKEFMSDTTNRGRVLFILMTNRPDKLDIDIKRAGRLDKKIPFLYGQSPEDIEPVLNAQFRKHSLKTEISFPKDRQGISSQLVGYSNADLEAMALLANSYAAESQSEDQTVISREIFAQAMADYLPSRDVEMLEYMELLAVFEASNRRMLPAKYANLSVDELQAKMGLLRLRCGERR